MDTPIKSLTTKSTAPAWWTIFIDATEPTCFSYARVTGALVIIIFLALATYLSLTSGSLIVPPKEWIYILVAFALGKPIQRFAETKEVEAQLNYDFQVKQIELELEKLKSDSK